MSDFALIARADRGGIAAQSWGLYRHLHPRRVLIVDLGNRGRGPTDPTMYEAPEQRVTYGAPDADDAAWLTRPGVSSVFTIEGLYSEAMRAKLEGSALRTIVQANPELYVGEDLRYLNAEVLLPTPWEAERFPVDTRILPVPVDTKALHPGLADVDRPEELVVFHPAGAAMADRNGTRLVLAALRHCVSPGVIRVANRRDLPRKRMGRMVLYPVADMPSHLDHWRGGIDLLVLPRRYGGLCLPLQEAAACGIPIITTDLEPQRSWVPPAGLVRVVDNPPKVPMKGGTFDVWSCQPGELAVTIDRFLADPGLRLQAGGEARAYAETISWENLGPVYQELLQR